MPDSATERSAPIRVLYCDGDPTARESLLAFFTSEERFTVEAVGDVQTAWDRLGATHVDCVVSEHDLPGTTGLEFLEDFRERHPDRPFVLYTAAGSEDVASEAIAAGVTEYVQRETTGDHERLAERIVAAVTEHARALDATLQRRAMDEAPIGITIADTSRPNDPLIYVNEGFLDLTGYEAATALGRNCRFLQGEDTAEESVTRLREAIERGESESVELVNYRRDGTEFWNRVTIAPLTDADDSSARFLGFQEDVTDVMERDRRQKAVVRVLRELYDVTTDTECSLEERIDRALALGREVLELPYGFLTEIEISDDESPDGIQTIVRSDGSHPLLQPGESCPLSRAYCRKTIETDGLLAMHDAVDAGWEDDVAYETFDLGSYIGGKVVVDGELYGTLCFAGTDARASRFSGLERTLVRLISKWVSYELEYREATRGLERQNERLEEFTSVVSHDVQNPLNVAQGRLQMAMEECESPYLEEVEGALERIEALVTDLLELAKHGDAATDLADVDLAAIVEGCWSNVETTGADLEIRTDRTIRADDNQLKQVLENLVVNAVTHGGGDVTVTVGDLEDGFFVEDDGTGIPAAERESVFEAGYTRSEDGTGFGLNIVEQVATSHGWDVTLTEGEGGGARFEFTGVTIVTG
jgi:PAS domain S-box-containing protein